VNTSLQRTYRYLRIGIAACVVVIAVSVVVASIQLGTVLTSISAYYYSPARTALVGALVAAGIGILALAGRGAERSLLTAAGLFAPLIAFVPTRVVPGTVPGIDSTCPGRARDCIPHAVLPTVQNGVITYVVVGLVLLAVAVGIAIATGQLGNRSVLVSFVVALVVVLAVGAAALWLDGVFLYVGHLLFAGIFFLLISAVALRSVRPFLGETPRSRAVTIAFGVIGVVMAVDVLLLVAVVPFLPQPGYLVLVGESIALGLFMAFWAIQSGRDWDSPNPTARPRNRMPAEPSDRPRGIS
jgi:hypothetical protein